MDGSSAIIAELRKLNANITEQSKLIAEQSKRSAKRDRKSGQKREAVDNPWASLGIEACGLLIVTAILCGYSQWQSIRVGEDGVIDKVLGTDFQSPLEKGDRLEEYTVTSGFGMRTHPISGEQKQHEGIDLDTPVGTNLYFPFLQGTVACKDDPGGYGLYASVTPSGGSENGVTKIILAHLSKCQSGSYSFGNGIALTGNSGGSTAPHLHFGQYTADGPVAPTKGWVVQAIKGNRVLTSKFIPAGVYGGVMLDAEQTQNAAQIIQFAQQHNATKEEIQTALMTALQEASLRNLDHGDDWWFDDPSTPAVEKSDSKGLFQRRGGGTDIELETKLFLERLRAVPKRESMSLAGAAQAAQKSAFPLDYQKWETTAAELLQQGY
jgi:murein DD-endopeptidase MepM/ murein hydrolase activator NlpD